MNPKPKKIEILVAITFAIAIVLGSIVFSRVPREPMPLTVSPATLPPSSYTPTYYSEDSSSMGGTSGGASGAIPQARVKDIRQTIVGALQKGTFEPCVKELHSLVDSYEGYVSTETLTYKDDVWSGDVIARIPQDHATEFVFDIRKLISDNGKVTTITTEVTDITGSIQEGESIPNASIKTSLTEQLEKPTETPEIMQTFGDSLQILTNILVLIGQGVVIGIPSFFALLGIAILGNRALLPLVIRLIKQNKREVK